MDKIEEIKFRELIVIEKEVAWLLEGGCYLEYFEGVKKDELNDTPYKIKIATQPLRDVAEYITTLIQEEVEEFARTSTAYNKGKRALMKEAKEYINE